MNYPTFTCSKQHFQNITQDLFLYGSENHELLTCHQEPQGFIPKTHPKLSFLANNLGISYASTKYQKKMQKLVYAFFEKNSDYLQKAHIDLLYTYSKTSPFLKDRYFTLIAKVIKNEDRKIKVLGEKLLIKNLISFYDENELQREECASLLDEAKKKATSYLEKSKNIKEQERQIFKQKEELFLQEVEAERKKLQQQQASLKKKIVEKQDTQLISIENQEILTFSSYLDKLPFFRRNAALKLHKKERFFREKIPFKKQVIQLFIQYLVEKESLKEVEDFSLLLDLYLMAIYFKDNPFKSDCLSEINTRIHFENVLKALSCLSLPYSDLLIQNLCDFLAKNFICCSKEVDFFNIRHEYLIQTLLFISFYPIQNEKIVFRVILWCEKQGSLNEVLRKECNGYSLINMIDLPSNILEAFEKETRELWKKENFDDKILNKFKKIYEEVKKVEEEEHKLQDEVEKIKKELNFLELS